MFFGQRVPSNASPSIKVKHVMATQPRDCSGQYGLAVRAQADLSSEIRGYGFVRRGTHGPQRLFDFPVGEKVQKGGLFQLDCQSLIQGAVKNSISGLVFKIRKTDR